jgi:hypothetical protein
MIRFFQSSSDHPPLHIDLGSSAEQPFTGTPAPACPHARAPSRVCACGPCRRLRSRLGNGPPWAGHAQYCTNPSRHARSLGKLINVLLIMMPWMPKMLQSTPIDITHVLSRTLRRSNLLLCLSHKFLHN